MLTTTIAVSQSQLDAIIDALQMPYSETAISRRGADISNKIVEQGWSEGWLLDDFLRTLDQRLGYTHFRQPDSFDDQFKLASQFAFDQNHDPDTGSIGHLMYSATTVACLLIWLERIGFNVDPKPMCDALTKKIGSQKFVTEEEITLLGYGKARHAMAPITLMAEKAPISNRQALEFTTHSGYKAAARYDAQGAPVTLVVFAPHYVEPRPQTLVTCPECQMTYVSGIRSDEHQHDIEHHKVVTTLMPVASRALRRAVSVDSEAIWVSKDSPKWLQIAVYRRARAFKREFRYDFVQWETGHESDAVAFLFHDDSFRITGACCFRPETEGPPNETRLDWIWLCPDQRRNGILTKNWDCFRERFGDFLIEPPISDAMKAFLQKRGDDHLLR